MVDEKDFGVEDGFSRKSLIFSFIALILGGSFGLLQLLERTPTIDGVLTRKTYYLVLTGHGVLMAIVWTAFFIMALAVFVLSRELKISFNKKMLNTALILSILGTLIAAITILAGKADVLYTFYPPLKAHVGFYLGLGVLIIGTWVFSAEIIRVYAQWRKQNKDLETPVATFGVLATVIVWLEATPPLVFMVLKNLVPMALFNSPVDVLESRTYFWYFGHPLVYFWIIPAVTLWYFAIPKLLNVELFSKTMAKIAFILFILASTPVGLHHQFLDPGVSDIAKFLQTILTFVVASPSLLTAFNVIATLERGGRKAGGKGVFGWIKTLPWSNPVFAGLTLSFIIFGFGGIGGIINASYTLNYIVHNTTWIVGHFHLTVGTATTLTFMAASYLLIQDWFKRKIYNEKIALAQPYLWAIGMSIFSLSYHIAGLLGVPRRTFDVTYNGLAPAEWYYWLIMGAVGGIVFWFSGVLYIANMILTILGGEKLDKPIVTPLFEKTIETLSKRGVLDKLSFWVAIAVLIIVIGYALPFYEIYTRGLSLAPPVSPEGVKFG